MLRTQVKSYRIFVNTAEGNAHLVCMTYSISVSKPYFGADFYQLLSTIDSPKLQVPYGRAFTFQESILLTCEGALVAPEGRDNIESWIAERMKEVYGNDCKVVVAEYEATPISADEV